MSRVNVDLTGGALLLDPGDAPALERYLLEKGLAAATDVPVRIEAAGAGNMNLTLRVHLTDRTFILKQGRPWVEKYDHIPAPWTRTLIEGRFYEEVAGHPRVAGLMPRLLYLDSVNHILVIEDLGVQGDLSSAYAGDALSRQTVDVLLGWLAALAGVRPSSPAAEEDLSNMSMRSLNHEHLFDLPLRDPNGLDLDAITPGLAQAASALKNDQRYRSRVAQLGDSYLADGPWLTHGDFFPGSWIPAGDSVRIIDPEFCFLGCREFDYGTMVGHLALARQRRTLAERVIAAADDEGLDRCRVLGFAGAEIMRRLIGVAQLPLGYGLEEKRRLLALSNALVCDDTGRLVTW